VPTLPVTRARGQVAARRGGGSPQVSQKPSSSSRRHSLAGSTRSSEPSCTACWKRLTAGCRRRDRLARSTAGRRPGCAGGEVEVFRSPGVPPCAVGVSRRAARAAVEQAVRASSWRRLGPRAAAARSNRSSSAARPPVARLPKWCEGVDPGTQRIGQVPELVSPGPAISPARCARPCGALLGGVDLGEQRAEPVDPGHGVPVAASSASGADRREVVLDAVSGRRRRSRAGRSRRWRGPR